MARGKTVVVVPASAGFEAATYDQFGHLAFWADASGSWMLEADRTYRRDSWNSETAAKYTGQGVTVSGALLPGMSDAVFLVQSLGFTGDGSGGYDVYARGTSGWGYVARQGASLVPTGRSATTAQDTFLGAWLLSTGLRTSTAPSAFGSATGSAIPLVDCWRWGNGRFILASSNTFIASLQPPRSPSALALPWGAPGTGTYGGVLQGVSFGPPLPGAAQPVVVLFVLPAALNARCVAADACQVAQKRGFLPTLRFTVDGNTASDYAVTTDSKDADLSGPAWFLALADPYPQGNPQAAPSNSPYPALPANPSDTQGGIPRDYAEVGAAPWYIPAALDVQSFHTIEGYVQLTFADGKLVHMTVY